MEPNIEFELKDKLKAFLNPDTEWDFKGIEEVTNTWKEAQKGTNIEIEAADSYFWITQGKHQMYFLLEVVEYKTKTDEEKYLTLSVHLEQPEKQEDIHQDSCLKIEFSGHDKLEARSFSIYLEHPLIISPQCAYLLSIVQMLLT